MRDIPSLNDSIAVFRQVYDQDLKARPKERRDVKRYIGTLKYEKRMARRIK